MSIPTQLNHYRILGPLGQGGMGEVFAAEDTRLHRKVAIKVLSGLMAGDPERRQRFEREAQAVAALNHPNIVTIYSVEEADGVPFISMELVEGRPLSEFIKAEGVPLDTLLRIGGAVSDAIGAAHYRGITHRDLKPANVMVGHDGRVKVLDFGLAKLREAEAEYDGETIAPAGDLTGEGRILGTVAYMSPEQAEGKAVDSRSDIFSLGVMLHEMAVGERPFKGDTNVSVISSILKDTPESVSDLKPQLPVGLSKVIRRSLAKDPSRRYQTAIDLRNELDELKHEVDSGIITTVSSPLRTSASATTTAALSPGAARPRGRWALPAAAAAVLIALGVGWYVWKGRGPAGASDFVVNRFTRVTTSGIAQLAAISGDGRYIVHIKNEGLKPSLWVRQTAAASDVQIMAPAPVRYDGLAFSPDGNYVYFSTYELTGGVGNLYRIPVLGGQPERVLDDIDSRVTFAPDGRSMAFIRGYPSEGHTYVMIAGIDGSGIRRLGTAEGQSIVRNDAPAWSPDGRTILAPVQTLEGGPHSSILAFDAATGRPTPIGGRWANVVDSVWMPDGRSFLLVAIENIGSATQIWQIDYPSGVRRRVTVDLNNYSGVTVSSDGASIATVQNEMNASVWTLSAADLAKEMRITGGRGRAEGLQGLAWTADGRVLYGSAASGTSQVWIANVDGSAARQLTTGAKAASRPTAPAAGNFVVFQMLSDDGVHAGRVDLDGSNFKQLTKGVGEFNPVVSPDGQWVYFTTIGGGANQPGRVRADGGDLSLLEGRGFGVSSVSPDGSTLLGNTWNASERRATLATLPATGGTQRFLNLPVAGQPAWTPDGKAVTYVDLADGKSVLMRRNIDGGAPLPLRAFAGEQLFDFAWSPDGRQLLVGRGTMSSDVVLIGRQ